MTMVALPPSLPVTDVPGMPGAGLRTLLRSRYIVLGILGATGAVVGIIFQTAHTCTFLFVQQLKMLSCSQCCNLSPLHYAHTLAPLYMCRYGVEASVGNFPTKSREAALAEATSGTRQREQEEGLAKQGGDEAARRRSRTVGCVRLSHAVRCCCCCFFVNMCLCVLWNELQCRPHLKYVISVYVVGISNIRWCSFRPWQL